MLLQLTTHHNFFFCGFSKFVIKDQLKMLSVVKSRLKIWMKEDFTFIEKGSMCADLQHFSSFST